MSDESTPDVLSEKLPHVPNTMSLDGFREMGINHLKDSGAWFMKSYSPDVLSEKLRDDVFAMIDSVGVLDVEIDVKIRLRNQVGGQMLTMEQQQCASKRSELSRELDDFRDAGGVPYSVAALIDELINLRIAQVLTISKKGLGQI